MRFKNTVAALAKVLGATFGNNEQLAFDNALAGELEAMDAEAYLDETEKKAACDSLMKELGKDSLDDDETREAYRRAAADKRAKDESAAPHMKPPGAADAVVALDAATITAQAREGYVLATDAQVALDAALTAARTQAAADVHTLYAVAHKVSDKVGTIALDSADAPKSVEAVYRFALTQMKVDHANVAADALPALYDGIVAAAVTQDAALPLPLNVTSLIPYLANIRKG
jgi:hypothetical protein